MLYLRVTRLAPLAAAFNAQILIILIAILTFISLLYVSKKLVERASRQSKTDTEYETEIVSHSAPDSEHRIDAHSSRPSLVSSRQQLLIRPIAISMMISIGIGLHNFGEGLAIGIGNLLGEVTSTHSSF